MWTLEHYTFMYLLNISFLHLVHQANTNEHKLGWTLLSKISSICCSFKISPSQRCLETFLIYLSSIKDGANSDLILFKWSQITTAVTQVCVKQLLHLHYKLPKCHRLRYEKPNCAPLISSELFLCGHMSLGQSCPSRSCLSTGHNNSENVMSCLPQSACGIRQALCISRAKCLQINVRQPQWYCNDWEIIAWSCYTSVCMSESVL